MPRPVRPSSLSVPALVYTGDRARLETERAEIAAKLRREPDRSPYRPALQRAFTRLTAQLVAIDAASPPVPGSTRKDLQ